MLRSSEALCKEPQLSFFQYKYKPTYIVRYNASTSYQLQFI